MVLMQQNNSTLSWRVLGYHAKDTGSYRILPIKPRTLPTGYQGIRLRVKVPTGFKGSVAKYCSSITCYWSGSFAFNQFCNVFTGPRLIPIYSRRVKWRFRPSLYDLGASARSLWSGPKTDASSLTWGPGEISPEGYWFRRSTFTGCCSGY